jgi:hypothetical protein
MRSFLISLMAFAVVSVGPPLADNIAVQNRPLVADGQAIVIQLIRKSGWIITFRPDGSVHTQYGAHAGDGASQPIGSVNFGALLKAVERLKSDKRVAGTSQVAVHRKGETTSTAFYLKDDTLFRYLITSFEDTWHPDLRGKRFGKLLELYPVYDSDEAREEKKRYHWRSAAQHLYVVRGQVASLVLLERKSSFLLRTEYPRPGAHFRKSW